MNKLHQNKVIGKCEMCDKNNFQVNHRKFSLKWSLLFKLFFLLSSLWIVPARAATDCAVQTDIPEIECEALVALYQSTNGADWNNFWWNDDLGLGSNEPCKWYGITCTDGRVTAINLKDNSLFGSLPEQLGNLSVLQELDLSNTLEEGYSSYNQLSGNLPPEWGKMSALQKLDLSGNRLSGNLPPEWSKMSALQYLNLGYNDISGPSNQLSGNLPPEWGNLSALQSLNLRGNQLSGNLPPEWGKMSALQELYLGDMDEIGTLNQLSGNLPPEWGKMSALRKLDLSGNQLSGNLPPEWGNLSALQYLGLNGNQLSGNLPPEWGKLSALQKLNLSGNQLSSSLPLEWGKMNALQELNLDGNQLSGNLPPEWGNLNVLKYLSLSGNQLSGNLPPEWSKMNALQVLELGYYIFDEPIVSNELSGNLPAEWSKLSALQELNLSGNQLSENLPPEWSNLSKLDYLNLSNNQLSGNLPPKWSNLSKLDYLNLSNNQLTGSLPPEWGNLSILAYLDLSNNQLSGNLPPEWDNLSELRQLYLNNNQLSGNLLPEWSNLSKLRRLYLNNNQLSSNLPPEWSTLSKLTYLDLNSNQLNGNLPPEWGKLNVWYLSLFNNQLSGSLPPEWSTLSALRELGLDSNELSGNLPPEWSELSELQRLNLSKNKLSGNLPKEWGNLTHLKALHLSNNQLNGTLPPEWGQLKGLQEFTLHNNELIGHLPPEWGKLNKLQYFELNNNHLSGDIPPDFTQLTQLLSFETRYNMLTAADPTVATFVSQYDPEWQSYQSSPPNDLTATVALDKIQLNWTPILYQEDGGYYEVGYSDHAGGSYTIEQVNGDKTASTHTITGLSSIVPYYFVVRTHRSILENHPESALISEWSTEIQAIPPTQMFSLTVTVSSHGSISGTGIQCGIDCDESYAKGTSVTLQANSDSGYLFTGWNGDCQNLPNPAILTIDQTKTCSANFELLKFPLTVHKSGTGEGTLTSTPEGIHCDDECTQSYLANTQITLTATPSTNSQLIQWIGDCSPLPDHPLTAQVILDQAKTCTATFEKVFSLNIAPTPLNGLVESGTIDKDGLFLADGQIQCGTDHALCTKNDALIHTQVTLQARANSGYLFTGWNGDCQNLPNPATLTIDQAKTCSASFMPPDSTITLAVEVERTSGGEGFVSGILIDEQNKPVGSPIIDCGKDCDENLSQAQKIRLTAVPGSTSTLTQWICNGQPLSKRENLLTLQQDFTCTARFEKDPITSLVTLSKTGQGYITAKRKGETSAELSCASAETCQTTKTFSLGRELLVTTTPDSGFVTRWASGSCRPDPKNPNQATLLANSDERSCHVEFVRDGTRRTEELSVQTNGEGVVTGNIQGSAYGKLYCDGKEACKSFYPPGTIVRLNAISSPFSVFKGWQGCQTSSSSSLLVTLPQSGENSCTAVFGDRTEETVKRFCKRIGEGGGYMMQGTQKIPVSNTFWCSASNQARLQEAFRLAYPVKMMMEMQQVVTQTWPDHFSSQIASWYRQYPAEIKNIRAMTAGNVEIQLSLKDEHDVEQLVTLSYGTAPTGEEGTILFKRSEEQFQRLYNLAGEVKRDFSQKLNDDAQVMALYKETENQTRLQNAFWLALPALMTAEENLRLGNEWPESFNGVSWYDPQPPWEVAQVRGNHTRGFKGIKFLAGQSIEIQLALLNNNHQEEEVSVLVYYGETPHGGILYPRGKE